MLTAWFARDLSEKQKQSTPSSTTNNNDSPSTTPKDDKNLPPAPDFKPTVPREIKKKERKDGSAVEMGA